MKILILAEGPFAADVIRRTLRYVPACEVLGFVDGRESFSLSLADSAPDVVVVDESDSSTFVLERVREARRALPQSKIVLLSARMDPGSLAELADAGMDAVIARSAAPATIGILVREIAAGHVFHSFGQGPPPKRSPVADRLTARELEILRLVAAGLPNSAIATQLWVTEQTVKFHLSNVYRKLGVSNRTQASHYAHVHRLMEAPPAAPAAAMQDAA